VSELTGKVVVLTGAASPHGIGFAMARRFAAAGASLFLADIAVVELKQRVAELTGALGPQARVEVAHYDLAEIDAGSRLIEDVVDQFGRIDVLCNNAAIRVYKPFGEFSPADFQSTINVNLAAPFFASQAVVPIMRRQGGGRIIHTASQLGTVASEMRAIYGLTKAALIHLTKSMALELAKDNILVNSISPGITYTGPIMEREKNDPDGSRQRLNDYVPAGRYGRPDEIAELAFFLATTSATYLQGENIVIDGGYVVH